MTTRRTYSTLLRLCCPLLLSTIVPAVGAQSAGRVFNPRINPANPDLVAFETLNGDRQELFIRRLSNGATFSASPPASAAPVGLVGLPGLASSENVSVFSGDADWRPVAPDGPQWFAYVASDRGAVKLFANFVDANGALSTREPMALSTVGSARHPRWSPDGRHLAFVSDSSVLYVFWNLDRALRAGVKPAVLATRVGAAGNGVLFPAWSPKGTAIAYQSELSERGGRRFGIEVLAIDTVMSSVRGAPILLTEELVDANAMRPSWSPDGKFIAYYVDRSASTADGANALDIGIAEVQTQPTTGRMLRGELLRGQARRIAEGVMANATRGPSWTRMYVGTDAKLAVVYVQRDDAAGNPIFVHSVDAWTAMRDRNTSRVQLSAGFPTVNHREVSATSSRGFVRYSYASVASGGEVISTFDDSTARWATGAAPMSARTVVAQAATPPVAPVGPKPSPLTNVSTAVTVQPTAPLATPVRNEVPTPNAVTRPSAPTARISEPVPSIPLPSSSAYIGSGRRGNSLGLAILFPGASQLAAGHTKRAMLLGAAGVLGGSMFVYGFTGSRYASGLQQTAPTSSARVDAANDFTSKRQMMLLGFGTAGAAWFVGVVDAAMHRDNR